ncbi:MAG: hypothetical protein NTY18_13520, partial [Deltaproteobacteria bacterium]|nr:hypothetical protein [Deltaproteobacteria bacterium]
MSPRIAWLFAALLVVAAPARAQFGDLLNRASKQAADAAAKAAKDAAKPAPEQPAPKEPASTPAAAKSDGAQPATAAPAGAAASPPAAEAFGNRYDFIPGDKVLVFDDFSDTDVGEYPAKWTIKGGGGNSLEVVQIGDRRFLKSRYQVKDQS